jgi:hemoglobin
MNLLDTQLFQVIGEEALSRLIASFYKRIPSDEILGPLYPKEDFAGAEQRLREFVIQRFGGPDHYSQKRGHPRLRMRHAPFAIDQRARDRWIHLMEQAIDETALPASALPPLRAFFHDAATFLINR